MKIVNYLALLVALTAFFVLKKPMQHGMYYAMTVIVAFLVGYAVVYLINERKKKRG